MTIKIDKKITGFDVNREEPSDVVESNVIQMHEKLERPEMLLGSTYKIKTPLTEHALSVTINDLVDIAVFRLEDGDVLTIGDYDWRIVVGSGHSPEHACLYCAALKIMISGDQILPIITSNVSVHPTEPNANPLKVWMESHDKFLDTPDNTFVLPAHNSLAKISCHRPRGRCCILRGFMPFSS